jgi:hypothetical protein
MGRVLIFLRNEKQFKSTRQPYRSANERFHCRVTLPSIDEDDKTMMEAEINSLWGRNVINI